MSLWVRFKRAMRSIFGGAISAMEDPRLILEQNIRELNDQVPKMNENIATVKASVIMLQKEVRRQEEEILVGPDVYPVSAATPASSGPEVEREVVRDFGGGLMALPPAVVRLYSAP